MSCNVQNNNRCGPPYTSVHYYFVTHTTLLAGLGCCHSPCHTSIHKSPAFCPPTLAFLNAFLILLNPFHPYRYWPLNLLLWWHSTSEPKRTSSLSSSRQPGVLCWSPSHTRRPDAFLRTLTRDTLPFQRRPDNSLEVVQGMAGVGSHQTPLRRCRQHSHKALPHSQTDEDRKAISALLDSLLARTQALKQELEREADACQVRSSHPPASALPWHTAHCGDRSPRPPASRVTHHTSQQTLTAAADTSHPATTHTKPAGRGRKCVRRWCWRPMCSCLLFCCGRYVKSHED